MKLEQVTDWAIFARANDMMLNGVAEEDAIANAIDDEKNDYLFAIDRIHRGEYDRVDAVTVFDDGFISMEDDYYTDDHMVEIREAIEKAYQKAHESTYEAEKEFAWYHR